MLSYLSKFFMMSANNSRSIIYLNVNLFFNFSKDTIHFHN